MNAPFRTSPLAEQLKQFDGQRELNGMLSLFTIADDANRAAQLGIADLSFLTRFGVKGAGAAAWLAQQGISIPDRSNTWQPLAEGGLVVRLGTSEFLIEDSLYSKIAVQLSEYDRNLPVQVYPVLRQDAAIAVCGQAVNELLRQTCNVNFQAVLPDDRSVVLTSMIGVAVTVISDPRSGQPFYRIWCDGTFGGYMWRTLLAIAEELGGGVVGADRFVR